MKSLCLCGATDYRELFTSGTFIIAQCAQCAQIRTADTALSFRTETYQEKDIQVYRKKEQEFRRIFHKITDVIASHIHESKELFVDIGAGVGLLVDEATKVGFDAQGFEPSIASVKSAKKNFKITLINKIFTFTNYKKHVGSKKSQVIILNHVLEHLPNPKQTLGDIEQVIEVGGLLVIGVPNFGSFLAQTKKALWQSLIPDQHRWHFTKRTLDNLVNPFGFKKIDVRTDNHDRSIHPRWKRPFYAILDTITSITKNGEAILVVYKKL